MDMEIRRVSLEDLDALTEVEAGCFPEAEAATRASLEKRIRLFSEHFFVAEIEGEIIGFINGCVTNETTIHDELYHDAALHVPDGDYQTVFGLDVMPDHRNQGIAARLMNHMIGVARGDGRKGVILTCKENLIPYYARFGFVNVGISASEHGGSRWYDMTLDF